MKVEKITEPLDGALLDKLKNASPGVYYLENICNVPYESRAESVETEPVTVFGQIATLVRADFMATVSAAELLVSDSFRPCVPIIAIGQEMKSLLHYNHPHNPKAAKEFVESCRNNQLTTIVVIQRTSPPQQINISNKIVGDFKLQGFNVELVNVPLDGAIGVMVIGSSVLVYPMFMG